MTITELIVNYTSQFYLIKTQYLNNISTFANKKNRPIGHKKYQSTHSLKKEHEVLVTSYQS